ncbi:cupin domain-containing protein [Streptomyces sp. ADMS]|uniref:cupin domain-containing protein n=1 Tax=Streptomyces sp. ADMS TaxID=3071415 RepID=UPI00296FD683|nr:cupin domain-containing protein [Streptomyces sp. ADMS]MDW4905908.1 cupin domain-containing protein [Streptomyces sp. ADMS]
MTSTPVRKVGPADVAPNRRRGGDVRILLSPRTVGSTSGFGGSLTLEPGEYVCEHLHPYSEEFVYVVGGRLRIRIGEELVDLEAHDSVMVPKGVKHRMVNEGDERAQVIFHLAPLAPRPELGHVDTEFLPGRSDEPAPPVGGVR